MGDGFGRYFRHQSTFQPAQDAQFGFWIAQAIEHHHTQQAFGIELTTVAQHATEGIGEAQLFPQNGEQPGITHRQGWSKRDVARAVLQGGLAGSSQQAIDQRVGFAGAYRFDAAQGSDDPLASDTGGIPIGFDELDVLTRPRGGCDSN